MDPKPQPYSRIDDSHWFLIVEGSIFVQLNPAGALLEHLWYKVEGVEITRFWYFLKVLLENGLRLDALRAAVVVVVVIREGAPASLEP